MSTTPKPQVTVKKPDPHQAAFEKLPKETKELMELKEMEVRTTGIEQAIVTTEIQDKARES